MPSQRTTTSARLLAFVQVGVCVLFGVAITLVLAWGPEVWRVVRWKPGAPIGTVDLDTYEATSPDGRVYRATRRSQGLRGEEWELYPIEHTAPLEFSMDPGNWPKRNPPHWVPWPEPDDVPPSQRQSAPVLHGSGATASGWPMRCLRRTESADVSDFSHIQMSGITWFRWNGSRHPLPGDIIWPGMLTNIALFLTAALAGIQGPAAVRRLIRRRGGRCLRCGYDRRGIDPLSACPECGAV